MEIIKYTEEHKIFRQAIRKFFEKEVIPHVEEWEEAGIVPRSIWKKMGDQGFLCMDVPEEYGGMGADFLYSVILSEELVRTNHSGLAAPLHSDVVVPYITAFASEELKHKYLPGCVSGDIITASGNDRAQRRERSCFHADHRGRRRRSRGHQRSEDIYQQRHHLRPCRACSQRSQRSEPTSGHRPLCGGSRNPRLRKGEKAEESWMAQPGHRGTVLSMTAGFPKPIGSVEKGSGFLMLMEKLQQERLMVCIGRSPAAERMLEMTIKYCQERTAFGKPISKFQKLQFKIVEMATEVKLGRTFLDKLVVDHMEGKNIVVEVCHGQVLDHRNGHESGRRLPAAPRRVRLL